MVKLLVELGADPDMVSMQQTPLLAASQVHHFQGKAEYADVISWRPAGERRGPAQSHSIHQSVQLADTA